MWVLLAVLLLATPVWAIPAFPGAEGWGAATTGARGGTGTPLVRRVTNLNATGAGSLQAAVSTSSGGAGILVVFTVAGYIDLDTNQGITVDQPHVTILGQTAPGGGVCLRLLSSATDGNFMLSITASNVIVRGLCFRHGIDPGGNFQATNLSIATGVQNVIVDSCIAQWGSDENVNIVAAGAGADTQNITIQRCIIAEPLQTHSTGMLVADDADFSATTKQISIHHNFFVHANSRNPRVTSRIDSGAGVEVSNNAIYRTTESGGGDYWSWLDIRGNYLKEGPDITSFLTDPGFNGRPWFANRQDGPQNPIPKNPSIHMSGNVVDYNNDTTATDDGTYNLIRDEQTVGQPIPSAWQRATVMTQPTYRVTVTTAAAAWTDLVTNGNVGPVWMVGNNGLKTARPTDAAIDRVLVDARNREAQWGTADYISDPAQVGGYPSLAAGTAYTDTDSDGMADAWETAQGLNPNDAADAVLVHSSGYLHLERFAFGAPLLEPARRGVTSTGVQIR